MRSSTARYCLISPCRNEAAFMRRTLDSVLAQTSPPDRWVIVDDGSTDDTPQILEEYAAHHECIRVVSRADRGRRSVGPGVIEAFYAGYEMIDPREFEFICKLDLDLDLPPRYFEILIARMRENPRIATCSGKPYYPDERGELVSEKCGDETSIGASKFYRVEAFEEIGGFVRGVMWDGIDCHLCRMNGWIACSWDEPDLRFIHLRPMGSSQTGILTGRMRHGAGQYFMGTGFIYMTASAVYRATRPPILLGGLGMWLGWMKAAITRQPRFRRNTSPNRRGDAEFRRFLRRYQWACLLKGKKRATEELNRQQESVWHRRSNADRSRESSSPQTTPKSQHSGDQVVLMHLPFDALSERETVAHAMNALRQGRGGWIITANLDHLRRFQRDAEYKRYCAEADLVVADGRPLLWAARLQGTPLPGQVAGSNLIYSLSEAAAGAGRRAYFLGGDRGTAEKAAAILAARFGLESAGCDCPEYGFEKDEQRVEQIRRSLRESAADIVYVAFGSPKQERFIAEHRHLLPGAWWVGVGISFSYVCGEVVRAPRWIQILGLEWLHRLCQEPRRLFKRYIVQGLPFAARLLLTALFARLTGRSARETERAAHRAG